MSTRTPITNADLGHHIRTIRRAAGVTHEKLAAATGMRAPQISLVETGRNVHSEHYATIAKALGFSGALALFRASDSDPKRKHLDRAWALLTEEQKARTLKFINRLVLDGD